MNKLLRLWRAFTKGFWQAWREVPPARERGGVLTMTIKCDDSQLQEAIARNLKSLEQLKQAIDAVNIDGHLKDRTTLDDL